MQEKQAGIQRRFEINNFTAFRNKMLNWANRFSIFCLFENNGYHFTQPAFECKLAAGCKTKIESNAGSALEALKKFSKHHQTNLFGYFGYDLKNETYKLASSNNDSIGFSDLFFFEPEFIITVNERDVNVDGADNPEIIFAAINDCNEVIQPSVKTQVQMQSRLSKKEYTGIIHQLQQHIHRGDCYEINFCQEFYAVNAVIDPVYIYSQLASLSPNPFSVLLKAEDKFCLSASPERYLKKTGNHIISQPMKGTSKRNFLNKGEDEAAKKYLQQSEKEKSENVMVVDLVRNDLSRICKKGSVKVDELFGVYSFPQVHQMISTVGGELNDEINWTDIIKATFPMGSMTGAPKKRVMELIEQYEKTKRGLFSGAIGYITAERDFDFNVVIRSILYNSSVAYLSFHTGSGITFYSDAEKEYEECLVKAAAMKQVLL